MHDPSRPKVDLNTADAETLVRLLRIDSRMARRIIALRPFHTVEELHRVWGIDASTLERLLTMVTAGPETVILPSHSPSSVQPAALAEPPSPPQDPAGGRIQAREPVWYPARTADGASSEAPTGAPAPRPEKSERTAPGGVPPAERKPGPVQPGVIDLDAVDWPGEEGSSTKPAAASPEPVPPPKTVYSAAQPRSPREVLSGRLLLIAILLVSAYFRFVGLNWDENRHQHPDERFITMVAEQIRPVSSLAEYFDTGTSTLNPLRFGSYTYGMLPLFITRTVAEWAGMTSYDAIVLVGRALSGAFDLVVVLLLYLLGRMLYGRRVGLLAAALYAGAVLPIQLSHYFAVDSFSTVFVVASLLLAFKAIPLHQPEILGQVSGTPRAGIPRLVKERLTYFALFGLSVGMAMACKVNTAPVFGVILLAGAAHLIAVRGAPAQDRPAQDLPSWRRDLGWLAAGILLAAVVMVLAFRIFQPYAFSGPGFFGLRLNPQWLSVIKEVTDQVAGKSEWPPNHHWTTRPAGYGWTNMVLWGLGLPLGLAAWASLAWAIWRSWKGDGRRHAWRRHLLLAVWIITYFLWQNAQFWRYMRYFLPIYPAIILLAAWGLIESWDRTAESRQLLWERLRSLLRGGKAEASRPALRPASRLLSGLVVLPGGLSLAALVIVLAGTLAYAFAFTRIYTQPITRIQASRWMLEHIPAPLNVVVESAGGERSYPIATTLNRALVVDQQVSYAFRPEETGQLLRLSLPYPQLAAVDIHLRLSRDAGASQVISEGHRLVEASDGSEAAPISLDVKLGEVTLEAGQMYYLHYTIHTAGPLAAAGLALRSEVPEDPGLSLDWRPTNPDAGRLEGTVLLTPGADVRINRLSMAEFHAEAPPAPTSLQLTVARDGEGHDRLASATWTAEPGAGRAPVQLQLPPVELQAGETYFLVYKLTAGGPLLLEGETLALETSWDDALPLSIDGYDPLGGMYDPLNLELYERDTPEKREKIISILEQTRYLVIPSNRSYDAMPRLPLRYPLTLRYYQLLFDCPCEGNDMEARASSLEPPFHSPLGFDLVAAFDHPIDFGLFSISDLTADEAFTVYDHPKVMVFEKSADFSVENVRRQLERVDLTQVLEQAPLAYSRTSTGLRLPADRLQAQKSGGTWSERFDPQARINRSQGAAVLAWYALLLLLGWLAFPLVFTAWRGLSDRGYAFARLAALLFVAWLAWILGSLQLVPFTQTALGLSVAALAVVSAGLGWRSRQELAGFVRRRGRHLLALEGVFLALFLAALAVRLGNPDLWNPWLGGEKPMEFSIFNAVLKAVYFPPHNPWFSGNYLNYYYYGYVVAAVPTRLLGVLPSIAFNLILPTWFAMAGAGAFSLAYHLALRMHTQQPAHSSEPAPSDVAVPDMGALEAAALGMAPADWPADDRPPDQGWNRWAHAVLYDSPSPQPAARGEGPAARPQVSRLDSGQASRRASGWAYLAGLIAVVALLGLGNLYQTRQLVRYLPEVGAPGSEIQSPLDRGVEILSGAGKVLSGQAELPGGKGRWYFDASRPILHDGPDTPIAEFPLFSFLYGDLHPHVLAMPVLLAILAWIASFLTPMPPRQQPGQDPASAEEAGHANRWPERIVMWFAAALSIGMLRPAHTWDYPSMLGLVGAAVVWEGVRSQWNRPSGRSWPARRHTLAWIVGRFLLLAALTVVLYRPFSVWFATAYSSVELWRGARTPLVDYLTVHGLFLFILTGYLAWLSWPWLAQKAGGGSRLAASDKPSGEEQPASPLGWILTVGLAVVGVGRILWITDYQAFIVGLPLLAWTLVLLFAPSRSLVRVQGLEHRLVLALYAAALGVTLLVEVVVLRGDVGRANMVMRYYNQAWIFFSVASGIALAGCLIPALRRNPASQGRPAAGWRAAWWTGLALLVLSAAAYPLTAVRMKITDRWPEVKNPPHLLDGMAYMLGEWPPTPDRPAIYDDEGRRLNLAVDYAGIRWMQENIPGTPTIVEGHTFEYRWGSRISVYTGLPTVVGWSWHVRQHNSLLEGSVVERRIEELIRFYNTTEIDAALQFLQQYQVKYIIVGDLERAYYASEGLDKFPEMVRRGLLEEAFSQSNAGAQFMIYRVLN